MNGGMPRTRYEELVALAEEHDGLLTSEQARQAGIADSVLVRLAQRGRLERTARGVYRIPYMSPSRFSQHQGAILWAKAHRGPKEVALSHATALAVYGISDANPSTLHITVPRSARLRRQRPRGLVVHRADLPAKEITVHEGIPLTTVARTVQDLLSAGGRIDLVQQAIIDARRAGFIGDREARQLRRLVRSHLTALEAAGSERPAS